MNKTQHTKALPPPPTNGVHAWVLEAAWHCRRQRATPEEAVRMISSNEGSLRAGRRFQRGEVEDAVAKAYAKPASSVAWTPAPPKPRGWSEVATRKLHSELGLEPADLWERSPVVPDGGLDQLDIMRSLFPDREGLLCIGIDKSSFSTATLDELLARMHMASLVVPCYMTARTGPTQSGRESAHAKANTGARRFVVLDFDDPPPEQHPSIIWHLGRFKPLVMVLSSGGKSLHAWFPAAGEDADAAFWGLAVRLGADPALWRNRSQFVRLPEGVRDDGNRQPVLYFNAEAIP